MTLPDDDRVYLSEGRFGELKEKLHDLKTKKRLEIAEHLEYAKGLGDLSENAEYQQAKEEQMVNEAEISRLEDILARTVLISHRDSKEVRVGSTIVIKKAKNKKDQDTQFTIVGREEADPGKGKISYESPLGKAFLGRKKNEKILVSTPRGNIEYIITEIA